MWDSVFRYVWRQRVARDQELFKIGQFGTEDHNRKFSFTEKGTHPPVDRLQDQQKYKSK